jgi:hypothetical protein
VPFLTLVESYERENNEGVAMNNPQLLIDAVVQQTMVFIAQLATAGGVRAPLAGVANQVFADLTSELEKQGVKKKVIADMFGMALRTYHRRSQELRLSRTEEGRTLWEAVYAFLGEKTRVTAAEVMQRFARDDVEILTGILQDLVGSGLVYRTGRGGEATYKVADQEDFDSADRNRSEANRYLVWLNVYRNGPLTLEEVAGAARLPLLHCEEALRQLAEDEKVVVLGAGSERRFQAGAFDVPLGLTRGWEAAVLDHFQAMTTAVVQKLLRGPSRVDGVDLVGGSTWSLDVSDAHPLAAEARGTLARIRDEVEDLRRRIDEHNVAHQLPPTFQRVVVYLGQYVRADEAISGENSP